MVTVITLGKWLRRGRQRAAIAQVLRKPMTASEICQAARHINPHVQLRDLWLIMAQLAERKLAVRLTPRRTNGRLYCLSKLGRAVVAQEFGVRHDPTPQGIDWRRYSWVARAGIRRVTLDGLAKLIERTHEPQTATALRKFLRHDRPVGLNIVIHALRDLLEQHLIVRCGENEQGRRLHKLSPLGQRIVSQLRR